MAIRLAQHYDAEIISADSRQFYQELDIAVAKPSSTELALATHHLIGHRSMHEHYNAGMFVTDVLQCLEQIFTTKETAIICGGSGLYIDALLYGLNALPAADPELRERLKTEYETLGLEYIQSQLQALDPEYYTTIDTKNPARILRALEIIHVSQKRLSQQLQTPSQHHFPYPCQKIVLEQPREILYQKINDRVEAMLQAGLEAEAESLFPHRALKSLQTVGYSEWFEYFDGKITKAECIDKIKQHTRNYAKRQITWFKKDKNAAFFDAQNDTEIIAYLDRVFKN